MTAGLREAAAPELLSVQPPAAIPGALHIVSPLLFSSFLSRKSGQCVASVLPWGAGGVR